MIEQEDIVGLVNDIIAQRGLLPTDNIVVVREGSNFVVVEGNRRLSACQVIHDTQLLPPEMRGRLNTAGITRDLLRATSALMAVVVPTRDDALTMIAKRHTAKGTRPWRPAAKSRFVASLHADGKSVAEIAAIMRTSPANVKRSLLEQHLLSVASKAPELADAEREVIGDQRTKANAFTRFFTLGPARRAFPLRVDDNGGLDKGDLTDNEFRQAVAAVARAYLIKRPGGTKPLYDTRDDALNVISYLRTSVPAVDQVLKRREAQGEIAQRPSVSSAASAPAPAQAKRGGRPSQHDRFFRGFACQSSDNVLRQISDELARIDHQRFPSAGHYLMRAVLEQTLWHAIKKKSKVGDLQAFAAAQRQGASQADATAAATVGSPATAGAATAPAGPPLAAHVGTQRAAHLPGLKDMISFCIQDKTIFPPQPARVILGQIKDTKSLADLVVHGHALANPTLLESAAALVRPFLEKVFDGTYL